MSGILNDWLGEENKSWKKWIITFIVMVFLLIGLGIFRGCCVTSINNYELGYRYDLRTGDLARINHRGYVLHPPFVVEIHTVDLRPTQVCINANSRVLNCKLVKFNPEGLELFLSWHGRNNYQTGTGEGSSFNNILMSYAYDGSGKTYPFLTVIRELKPEEGPSDSAQGTKL